MHCYACTHIHTFSVTGARLQLKLLENALLSLLQCESILHYYSLQSETAKSCEDHSTQPNTERPGNDSTRSTCTSEGCSDDDDRSAVGGGSQDDASLREEESDAIVSLLLQRLLNVLKQLVAIAMKKRYTILCSVHVFHPHEYTVNFQSRWQATKQCMQLP